MRTQSDHHHYYIGIDRGDAEVAVCILTRSGAILAQERLSSSPEALKLWVESIKVPEDRRIAVCVERPCPAIALFLRRYDHIDLHLVNPLTLKRFRETFDLARTKADRPDAQWLAELVFQHRERLPVWKPLEGDLALLEMLVEERRHLVDERTRLGNRITSCLKAFYPQALALCGDHLHAPLACAFLSKWPTLQELKAARPETIRRFYIAHSCRRPSVLEARLEFIAKAVALTDDTHLLEARKLQIGTLVPRIALLRKQIEDYEERIGKLFDSLEDARIFGSLPGAGACLAPRLLVAFGDDRTRFENAAALQRHTGVAPVTKQSGNTCIVHRRFSCRKFLRQTFVEWAGQTIPKSEWARAFYQAQRAKGKRHHTALRALAFKWQRILFQCWLTHTPYDETTYIHSLIVSGSPLAAVLTKNIPKH